MINVSQIMIKRIAFLPHINTPHLNLLLGTRENLKAQIKNHTSNVIPLVNTNNYSIYHFKNIKYTSQSLRKTPK